MDAKKLDMKKRVLDQLMNDFGKSDIDDLVNEKKGMQKVSVIAKDKEGLKKGLMTAEDVLSKMPGTKPLKMDDDNLDEELREGHEMDDAMNTSEGGSNHDEPSKDEDSSESDYSKMSREDLIRLLCAKK